MADVQETQEFIKQKLEASGQLGKMRAMVTEASLAAIKESGEDMFTPSKKLTDTTSDADGLAALALVQDLLNKLGLAYTAKVLEMEAAVPTNKLPTAPQLQARFGDAKGDPILFKVIQDADKAPVSAYNSKSAASGAAPVPAPVAVKAAVPAPKPAVVSTPAPATTAAPAGGKKKYAPNDPEKPDDDKYWISKFENREFYRHNQVAGQQVQIEYLKNCKVFILDPVDSITVDDCEDCEFFIVACEGSIFLRTSKNLTVTSACKQMRTRDCEHMDLRLFAGTDPVIEASHHITFRPYNVMAPGLINAFKEARLDAKVNRFVHIYDFTEEDPKIPKPHSILKYPEHDLEMVKIGSQFGTPECPAEIQQFLDLELAPAPSSESGQNKSFNIKTGAKQWAKDDEEEEEEDNKKSADVGVTRPAAVPVPKPAAAPAPASDSDESAYSSFEDSDEF